ncbi:MAG TPA: hypothetical protein DD706_16555 [Nitrospiraceae bacterium]|nr:hypothetical protein [Nitrospiraceae bacterium]
MKTIPIQMVSGELQIQNGSRDKTYYDTSVPDGMDHPECLEAKWVSLPAKSKYVMVYWLC